MGFIPKVILAVNITVKMKGDGVFINYEITELFTINFTLPIMLFVINKIATVRANGALCMYGCTNDYKHDKSPNLTHILCLESGAKILDYWASIILLFCWFRTFKFSNYLCEKGEALAL